MQFEGKENKKSVVSEGLLENTSSNQDEEKDRDEPVDAENDKELAGNGDKVGEEISKNSHLIVNGRALLHKVFWFGKTFGDIVRAFWFYLKTSFAVCAVGFDDYENNSTKDR